jgi:hypothetical protein
MTLSAERPAQEPELELVGPRMDLAKARRLTNKPGFGLQIGCFGEEDPE